MLGPFWAHRDAPAAEPGDVLVGLGGSDRQDGAAPHAGVGGGSILWSTESHKDR